MAGSYLHVTNDDGTYRGTDLLDNFGDAAECIDELWHMIAHLTGGDKHKIHEAWLNGYARKFCPPSNSYLFTYERFWGEDK